MRLTLLHSLLHALVRLFAPDPVPAAAPAPVVDSEAKPPAGEANPPDDGIGELVVEATRRAHHRPRIAVVGAADTDEALRFVTGIVVADLDLYGDFRLVDPSEWPADPMFREGAPDVAAWAAVNVEALVWVAPRIIDGSLHVVTRTWLPVLGQAPADATTLSLPTVGDEDPRQLAHQTTDALLEVITGFPGGFDSRLVVVAQHKSTRRAWTMDPDGRQAAARTEPDAMVVSADLAPDGALWYVASLRNGAARLYREGTTGPLLLQPSGSIEGMDLSPDGSSIAMSIASPEGIGLYKGRSDTLALQRVRGVNFALHPSWSASGQLAYAVVGARGRGMRIRVDGRYASPSGTRASSPTLCDHPDGTRLVYVAGTRKRSHLVVADASGKRAQALTHSAGRDAHPACSPDGRMVAFVSSGARGRAPGIWVVSIEGGEPQQVSRVVGDTLRWTRRGR